MSDHCKYGHEKNLTRQHRGKEVKYCGECNRRWQKAWRQKHPHSMRKQRCKYGHPLPALEGKSKRRSCQTCIQLAREAKEFGVAAE